MNASLKQCMLAATTASMAAVCCMIAVTTAAHAAPPTAQVSPGYDARLAEGRKAAQLAAHHRWIVPVTTRHHHHRSRE
jgi:hypothetical protein